MGSFTTTLAQVLIRIMNSHHKVKLLFLKIEKRIRQLENINIMNSARQAKISMKIKKLHDQLHALDPARAVELATEALNTVIGKPDHALGILDFDRLERRLSVFDTLVDLDEIRCSFSSEYEI